MSLTKSHKKKGKWKKIPKEIVHYAAGTEAAFQHS